MINRILTILYFLGLRLYDVALWLALPFNSKAKKLVRGRQNVWRTVAEFDNSQKSIWVHAASLGEFEQGRPIIEAIKQAYPTKRIVLTFFSPSGYEVRHNYNLADLVCYLPSDSPRNARRFIQAINPEMAFFVKYEYWYYFLNELKNRQIAVYGVSQIFRREQPFFQPYGAWFVQMLHAFKHLYIQDEQSAELLRGVGVEHFTVSGDTRFDRVVKIATSAAPVELAERFVQNAKLTVVAGSTWEPDEDRLIPYINSSSEGEKFIIATHEIGDERIKSLTGKLKVQHFRFTDPPSDPENYKVMVVDTIGLLSAIYKYGQIAYIGGGFGRGIHNTLEAAAYGMPVIFGPNHKQFKEACDLISVKAGFTYLTANDLKHVLDNLRTDISTMAQAQKQADAYVKSMCGATERIMRDVFNCCETKN